MQWRERPEMTYISCPEPFGRLTCVDNTVHSASSLLCVCGRVVVVVVVVEGWVCGVREREGG